MNTDTDQTSSPNLFRTGLFLLLPLLTLSLFTFMVHVLPCWAVAGAVLVLAYPIWRSMNESFLFRRRVVLTGSTHADSHLRRWLWPGRIGSVVLVVRALVLAAGLLAMAVFISVWHWLVLWVDALVITVMYYALRHHSRGEVHPAMLGVFVRRWPLWLANLWVLSLAFLALNAVMVEAPTLHSTPWVDAVTQTFRDERQSFTCLGLGTMVGIIAGIEFVTQYWITQLPSLKWQVLAWLLCFLPLGLLAYSATLLQLGILTVVEQRAVRIGTLTDETTLARSFIATIVVMATIYLVAAHQLRNVDLQHVATSAREHLEWWDPCKVEQEELSRWTAELSAEQQALVQQIDAQIDHRLDHLFAQVEVGVEVYLDWYFTVTGEYQRLASLLVGDFATMMAERLERHLFTETQFEQGLTALDNHIHAVTWQRLTELRATAQAQFPANGSLSACSMPDLDSMILTDVARDAWRAGGAATGGSVTGVTTVALTKKVVAGTMAKLAIQETAQAAVTIAAKMTAKKGTGVLATGLAGAALCAATGPGAVLCGVGAATVAWVSIDKIAIGVDEHLSRDRMRADIIEALEAEREDLRKVLQSAQRLMIMHGM